MSLFNSLKNIKVNTNSFKILKLVAFSCGFVSISSAACQSNQLTAGENCVNIITSTNFIINANNVYVSSSSINALLTINSGVSGITLRNAMIAQLNNQGTIATLRSIMLPRIYNNYHYNGTITELYIGGALKNAGLDPDTGYEYPYANWDSTNNRFSISINASGNQSSTSSDVGWNSHNSVNDTQDAQQEEAMKGYYNFDESNNAKYAPQHIYIDNNVTVTKVQNGAIGVKLGPNGAVGDVYKYSKVILKGTGNDNSADGVSINSLTSAMQGFRLEDRDGVGFVVLPDASESYGASMLKTLTLSHLRREVLVREMLDSMTTKTFRSSYHERREEALQDLKDKEAKILKNKKLSKKQLEEAMLDIRIARSQLTERKATFTKDGYNEEKLFDQMDQIYVPYKGDKNWLSFFVPYSAYSTINDTNKASEFAGGGILGGQRSLGAGRILGLYLGYEYAYAEAQLRIIDATANTHSLFLGANYFMPFHRRTLSEYYLRVTGRGGVDLPTFQASIIKINNLTNVSFGGEVALGGTFFAKTKTQYLSPEINFSYDIFSLFSFTLNKQAIQQGNEYYPTHIFNIPQVGAGLKWYRAWGNMFRTSIRGGVKYNILNTQQVTFTTYGLKDTGELQLPNLYGTLDVSGIWAFNQNQQITAGYTGIYFSTGISSALMLKWQMWF